MSSIVVITPVVIASWHVISAAITALERCAPLPLAPALGDNIAGQVFTMRFPASG